MDSVNDGNTDDVPTFFLFAGEPEPEPMERERNLQRLSDLSIDDQIPDDLPDPDYDEEGPGDDSNGHVPYTVNFDDWQKMSKQRDAENFDIPEPDYQDEDDADLHGVGVGNGSDVIRPMYLDDAKDPQGLIAPKKLANPCVDSRERQQLHREMFMNQKMGKDVLRQKSELRRELDRRRDTQKKKEQDDFVASKRTSFELKLEEQANKLKQLEEEKMQTVKEEDNTPEFVKMKDRLKKKSGDKS